MLSDSYKIVVDPVAGKDLLRLSKSDKQIANKIIDMINGLAFEPAVGKSLKADKKGCYSLRYGDWRVIYVLYHTLKTVHIIRVGHRKDIYR